MQESNYIRIAFRMRLIFLKRLTRDLQTMLEHLCHKNIADGILEHLK